jgi:hypothetical protein
MSSPPVINTLAIRENPEGVWNIPDLPASAVWNPDGFSADTVDFT